MEDQRSAAQYEVQSVFLGRGAGVSLSVLSHQPWAELLMRP